MLRDEDILKISSSTVIRKEGDRILLFNSLSDEMYLVPKQALQVIDLCLGMLTVREIEHLVPFNSEGSANDKGYTLVKRFLHDLVDRKLLVVHVPEIVISRRVK